MGEGSAVRLLIYRDIAWRKREGIMPLFGTFAQFIVICMNNRHRVEGDNERAGRMQAGRRRDGRMARERGGEGGANA